MEYTKKVIIKMINRTKAKKYFYSIFIINVHSYRGLCHKYGEIQHRTAVIIIIIVVLLETARETMKKEIELHVIFQ